MFKITEGDFKNQTYGDESYLSNWPMLYILENGKQAYIGESNHVKNRMSQHHSSVDKRIFDKVHFIYSSRFNQSVTFDYESKLIQYIVADELYEVRNKNAGMADKRILWKKRILTGLTSDSAISRQTSVLFQITRTAHGMRHSDLGCYCDHFRMCRRPAVCTDLLRGLKGIHNRRRPHRNLPPGLKR